MSNKNTVDWARVDAALDELMDLPAQARPEAIIRLAAGDPQLQRELETLAAELDRDDTWLDRPAAELVMEADQARPVGGLAPGQRVGAYRIVAMIGRGGMGEVYRAERADGHFQQQVALKLIRHDAIDHIERFQAEREILAQLEHPGITRIYDGGLLDGQPYMVMELVTGQPITDWCRDHHLGLDDRLKLFLTVCDAVAYAHRTLIVHRDLKPSNILVTPEGQVKLLDFGIAKRIAATADAATLQLPLTPSYAAPEQLTGSTISTATDAYALGMLLFELLVGVRPWALDEMPLAVAVRTVLQETAPVLHEVIPPPGIVPPVPAKALAGDLSAIVAKALRKEPTHRYETVEALARDITRMREGHPVSARDGSRFYVVDRFVRRHRWPIAAAAVVLLTLVGGLGGVTWQYLRAQEETVLAQKAATRAEAIKSFVVGLFSATDDKFPKDKQRRDVSAETLLTLGLKRVERDFAQDPGLALELYGITSDLYQALDDPEGRADVAEKKADLARKAFGETHPMALEALLDEVSAIDDLGRNQIDRIREVMARLDVLLRTSGQDNTGYRARWWMYEANLLGADPHTQAEILPAYDRAIDLYARYAPNDSHYPSTLQNAAVRHMRKGDYEKAASLYQEALEIWGRDPHADNGRHISITLGNQAIVFEKMGRMADAERNYEKAGPLALAAYGVGGVYGFIRVEHARLLHQLGERERSLAIFTALLDQIAHSRSSGDTAAAVKMIYGNCLRAEGRAAEAIPLLQEILDYVIAHPDEARDIWALKAMLGQAYAQVGRADEARAALSWSLEQFLAHEPNGKDTRDLRGAWAWFLLDQGDDKAAAQVIDDVIRDEAQLRMVSTTPALAWAGRARLALKRGDAPAAAAAMDSAFTAYAQVKALHDARVHTTLLLTRATIRLAAGDKAGAAQDAKEALADARRMDAPESPVIRQAQAAVAASEKP
ncbi:protein kinase domain-containing protein [Nitrospirillum amazonense]|nr:protein kinase [Nitrospirillum amazonense]